MIEQLANLKIWLLLFQYENVWCMTQQEHSLFSRWILADEMDMDKTLQAMDLMLVNCGKRTLVVCLTVALIQWISGMELATDVLSVLMYYDTDRQKIADVTGKFNPRELEMFVIVLTIYTVLGTAYRQQYHGYCWQGVLLRASSVLHKIDWYQTVFDRAHYTK
ncbi:DNA repair protein rad16, partial [Linderina pennispora]